MKNVNIRVLVLLGAFSITSIILFQVYWIYHTYTINSNQFNQRVKIALYSVAEHLADFSDIVLPYNVVNQVTSNYFVVNTATHIDAKILEHYLTTVFQQHNIPLDCEYAIYDCESNEMTYGNYLGNKSEDIVQTNPVKFKKQEGLVYYFGVIFPGKTNYILQNINVWFISSVIIIMALAFFSYAIFIILQQKRLSEIQKDFVDNMTHEFKTPISSIALAAHSLQEPGIEKDPDRINRYSTIIAEQNKRLQKHIESVLQVVAMQKIRKDLNKELFDLNVLIDEVIDATDNHSRVMFDPKADNAVILADRHHVSNILYNLLDNARKYAGENAEIRVSTRISGRQLVLSVMDKGPGIESRYLKHIFDKFFRVPTGNIHTVKGFGLGLFYVKRIVEDHGWKIDALSEVGEGTTINIEINIT
jgi:two-component system phosphate regulon sensor histidine kinase PhoR